MNPTTATATTTAMRFILPKVRGMQVTRTISDGDPEQVSAPEGRQVAEHYKKEPGTFEPHAATLHYVVAAAGA